MNIPPSLSNTLPFTSTLLYRWCLHPHWVEKLICKLSSCFSILWLLHKASAAPVSASVFLFFGWTGSLLLCTGFLYFSISFFVGYAMLSRKRSQQWLSAWACCCSVTQSSPTLCDPVNCSTPGHPVHQIGRASCRERV